MGRRSGEFAPAREALERAYGHAWGEMARTPPAIADKATRAGGGASAARPLLGVRRGMTPMMKPDETTEPFALDIETIRKRARLRLLDGAVTPTYRADKATILTLLNGALATELVCALRYKRHYVMSANLGGIPGFAVTNELAKHATEELSHADMIASRIVMLGGEPNFDPRGLAERSHADYVAGNTLAEMLEEDLVAERIAIDVYSEMIRYIGDRDATTRRMLESILEQEEEHADDLADLLQRLRMS